MKHISLFFLLFLSLIITACGGGGGGGESAVVTVTSTTTPTSGTKSISVRWDIPTTRVNGDPISLSEISGFKIYVASNNNFTPSLPNVTITDNTTTDFIINNLASGTYYIYITTYDVNGDESPYSNPIAQTV